MTKQTQINDIKPFTQYNASLSMLGKRSACGPTTIATIINYYEPTSEKQSSYISKFYKESGTTWLGLPAWQLVMTLKKYGETDKITGNSMWDVFTKEIDHNRVVAIKFDQWSSFKWFSTKYRYRYHWVTGVGYKLEGDKRFIVILDNGGYNKRTKKIRKSNTIEVSYEENKPILTMITFKPI